LRNEPCADVGRFAAFSRQITSLSLRPWEWTVVYADTPEAHALLRRLKAAGLSRHEPDPVAAFEAADGGRRRVWRMSAPMRFTDSSLTSRHVRKVPIVLQKSKIERRRKSRKS
jgi:hypothetical protein